MLLPALLASLSEEDRKAFTATRAALRREYLGALAHIAGADHYDETDDRILDAIDMRVHSMFARAGRTKAAEAARNAPQGEHSDNKTGNVNGGDGTGVAETGLKSADLTNIQEQMAVALGEAPRTEPTPPVSPWVSAKA